MRPNTVAIAGMLTALLAASLWAQTPDARARQQRLGAIGTFRANPPAEELRAALLEGLGDHEPRVRETALYAIAGRASGARRTPEVAGRLVADRTVLMSLREPVVAALRDENNFVRLAAGLALLHLASESEPGTSPRISDEGARILFEAYRAESNTFNRGELIKNIALSSPSQEVGRTMLVQALNDPHDHVIAYALRGLAAARVEEALPELAARLTHASRNVRLAAAMGLARFGAAAKGYLRAVQEAVAAESDPTVRHTLDGVVKALQQAK